MSSNRARTSAFILGFAFFGIAGFSACASPYESLMSPPLTAAQMADKAEQEVDIDIHDGNAVGVIGNYVVSLTAQGSTEVSGTVNGQAVTATVRRFGKLEGDIAGENFWLTADPSGRADGSVGGESVTLRIYPRSGDITGSVGGASVDIYSTGDSVEGKVTGGTETERLAAAYLIAVLTNVDIQQ